MGRRDIFGSSPFPVPPKSLTDPLSPQGALLHMVGAGPGLGHLCQDPADLCSCLTLSSCRGGVGCRRCSPRAVCRLQAGDPFPPNPRGTEVGRETAGCN